MSETLYHFKVGDFECIAVLDMHTTAKAADFFPEVSDDELKRACEIHGVDPDALDVAYTCLVVNTGKQRILLDAGYGQMYDMNGQLLANLETIDLKPEDFDAVILTHLNLDHFGGLTDKDGNILFKNAKIYTWEGEWHYWTSEKVLTDRAQKIPDYRETVRRHLFSLESQMTFINQEGELFPGIRILHTPGHSPHHIVISVESAGESLLFIGDAFAIPSNITYPQWVCVFDHGDLKQMVESRKRLIKLAAERNALVHGFHFPFPGLGYVRPDGDTWRWEAFEESKAKTIDH